METTQRICIIGEEEGCLLGSHQQSCHHICSNVSGVMHHIKNGQSEDFLLKTSSLELKEKCYKSTYMSPKCGFIFSSHAKEIRGGTVDQWVSSQQEGPERRPFCVEFACVWVSSGCSGFPHNTKTLNW